MSLIINRDGDWILEDLLNSCNKGEVLTMENFFEYYTDLLWKRDCEIERVHFCMNDLHQYNQEWRDSHFT